MTKNLLLPILVICMAACTNSSQKSVGDFNIEYEKFELENGLDVILHVDRSDPIVAVGISVHVGSAREKKNRTGFAHLFEHLLFLESENLGKGGLDQLSARVGGSGANGYTTLDHTNYFQTVPNNALEKMIWAEADKLGWFINTVTEPVLAKEKHVVKNEKRQGIDNSPYGHTWFVMDKNLYPEDHPYNWQVIGSLEDLQNSTLDDVKEFYKQWYVPNNTTLFIAGDFDTEQAMEWVHKYFDEIPTGKPMEAVQKRNVVLDQSIRLMHEDNFANLPELNIAWPGVPQFHPDGYALDILTSYFSEGKQAPLYQVIVENEKLSSNVTMYHYAPELAGKIQLRVRAFEGTNLDTVYKAIQKGLAKFEAEGISEKDLDRIKALTEVAYYDELSTVLDKGLWLAQLNLLTGDPDYINRDIKNSLRVSTEDVARVYEKYIKDKKFVATSFVPKGSAELALVGSRMARVVEEEILEDSGNSFDPSLEATYDATLSTFDRSKEPPYGAPPQITVPKIWNDSLSNGLMVYGIDSREVPLVQFTMLIEGGQLLDDYSMPGVANLTAQLLLKGTQNKTPRELDDALKQLGASLNFEAEQEHLKIWGKTLAKNYVATLSLLEEILIQPRWDAEEFDLLKQSSMSNLHEQQANPNSIANNEFKRLIYGDKHMLSKNILGSVASIESISIKDLKDYYATRVSPSLARMHVVGAVDRSVVLKSLKGLEQSWEPKDISIPEYIVPAPPAKSIVYFYDIPDAKQSVVRIGYPALAVNHIDYYPATVMNYILGGGGFVSRLTQEVREAKGYTYGIWSGFNGGEIPGPFTIGTSIQTNITLEATELIKEILKNYTTTYSEEDLETTQSAMIKSTARAFERGWAKINMLENIGSYGWNYNYMTDREQIVKDMTVKRINELSLKYINPNRMIWLIAGDAKTQLKRMHNLGFGEPILIPEMHGVE